MDARSGALGWLAGPVAGVLVILISIGFVRQSSRTVQAGLREAARLEALAAANGAAHTVEIYFQERAAEAEYLGRLCADGSIRSVADFELFAHTIAESHGEYRGFRWQGAADGPVWSRPTGYEPLLPGQPSMAESALREVRETPAASVPAKILVGRDPSTGDPIIGILRPMSNPDRSISGVFYAECGSERLAQVLTIPFYQGRFGYLVSVGGQPIWSDGGPEPSPAAEGSRAQIETDSVRGAHERRGLVPPGGRTRRIEGHANRRAAGPCPLGARGNRCGRARGVRASIAASAGIGPPRIGLAGRSARGDEPSYQLGSGSLRAIPAGLPVAPASSRSRRIRSWIGGWVWKSPRALSSKGWIGLTM